MIDLKTGGVAHWLKVEGMVTKTYDIVALSGSRRPMALGFNSDEIQRILVADKPAHL